MCFFKLPSQENNLSLTGFGPQKPLHKFCMCVPCCWYSDEMWQYESSMTIDQILGHKFDICLFPYFYPFSLFRRNLLKQPEHELSKGCLRNKCKMMSILEIDSKVPFIG